MSNLDKAFVEGHWQGGWDLPEVPEPPHRDKMIELIRTRMRNLEADIKKQLAEKLYMSNIKVGDRVEAPRHGRGKVLAIAGNDAWVQTEGKDYPLTFDLKKLKLVPKPWTGHIIVYDGPNYRKLNAVELTDEIRERLKDLL